MSRKKQIIALVIGLVFISGIISLKIYPSMSQTANSTNQTKTVAKAEVVKQAGAEESNNKLAQSAESSSAKAQPGSNVAKTTPATKSTAATQPSKSIAPQPAQTTQAAPAQRQDNVSRGGTRSIYMVATGYTDAPEENYPWAGAPSYIGLPLARGIAAVDPNFIPMGTKLYVEGYGEAIAADQGGAIKGNRIDLFFDSKWEANTWGMKTVKVTIIE